MRRTKIQCREASALPELVTGSSYLGARRHIRAVQYVIKESFYTPPRCPRVFGLSIPSKHPFITLIVLAMDTLCTNLTRMRDFSGVRHIAEVFSPHIFSAHWQKKSEISLYVCTFCMYITWWDFLRNYRLTL